LSTVLLYNVCAVSYSRYSCFHSIILFFQQLCTVHTVDSMFLSWNCTWNTWRWSKRRLFYEENPETGTRKQEGVKTR